MTDNGQNTDDVDQRVRTAILDGELQPGAVMSQVALAEELGISRTTPRRGRRGGPSPRGPSVASLRSGDGPPARGDYSGRSTRRVHAPRALLPRR